MPFDPDQEYSRLTRLLNVASRLKRQLGENATLDDADERRGYHEQKAERIYDTYVEPLREKEELSDLEQRHLGEKEAQMEDHADTAEQLQRDIDLLTTSSVADMTTPLVEVHQTLQEEQRRLSRYKQSA